MIFFAVNKKMENPEDECMEFQINKPEYVNKTFRIPKELSETLSRVAQSEGISMNELVVQCCKYALSNRKDHTEKKFV